VLELRKAEDEKKAEDDNNLVLVIESPSHGVSRTVLLASNLTVAEAIARFTKKNPVGNTSNYCLFTIGPNGEHQKMELLFKLAFYQLKNKVIMTQLLEEEDENEERQKEKRMDSVAMTYESCFRIA